MLIAGVEFRRQLMHRQLVDQKKEYPLDRLMDMVGTLRVDPVLPWHEALMFNDVTPSITLV